MKYVNVADGEEFPLGLHLYNQCERWKGVCLLSENWGIRIEWSPKWYVCFRTPRGYYAKTGKWPPGYRWLNIIRAPAQKRLFGVDQ